MLFRELIQIYKSFKDGEAGKGQNHRRSLAQEKISDMEQA